MDEDMRDKPDNDKEEQDPRQSGSPKPGVETWPVVPGGKPGAASEE